MMGHRDTRYGLEGIALGRGRRRYHWQAGVIRWAKRAGSKRQRREPVSLDMYDVRTGGWLHESECEPCP